MNRHSPSPEDDGLEATRTAMRRDLNRANTAVGIVLVVVLCLATVAVIAGMRASRNSERALKAEAASTDQLWNSYIAQTRAVRLITDAGRREKIFNVISNAAAIRKDAALRSEAIATLALADIETSQPLQPMSNNFTQLEMDRALEHFAYGNATGEVFIHRLKDGTRLQTLQAQSLGPGTRLAVNSLVFSPDGGKIAARFAGGAVVVWDLASGARLMMSGVAATNLLISRMSFWPDGNQFVFADAEAQGQITVFDLAAKAKVSTAIRVGTRPFRFRPGTMEVAIASDNRVDLCRYPDEMPLQSLETSMRIYTMEWSPDGTQLAVSTEDGDIYLWDAAGRSQRILRGHSEPCTRLSFSPNGGLLASGSRDGTTRLWDVAQGQTLVVATEGIACTFSQDGQHLGYWKYAAGYGVWKFVTSDSYDMLVCPKSGGAFLSLDLSPSGRWCIAAQGNGVRLWDLKNGARGTFIPSTQVQSARITPDETALYVCRGQRLERWLIETNQDGVKIDPAESKIVPLPDGRGARAFTISLDGNRALVELNDRRLAVINLATNTPPVFLAKKSRQLGLRAAGSSTGTGRFNLSPDGRWAVTGFGVGDEDHPMVWDAQTGELVKTLDFGTAVVVFSPDGRRLGTAGTADFALWSVDGWRLLNQFKRDEVGVSHGSLAFIRDSDEIAVTRTRQLAQLRDGMTNETYADLIAPQLQSVNSMRMSLDGEVLVTASATVNLQVWHLDALRKKLAPLNLDWRTPQLKTPAGTSTRFKSYSPTQITLVTSLAGFGLAAIFALASLRRHRAAISAYLKAETKAAQRSREFEIAKVELMHSQKMQALGTLAAGIAHDFNNLLSVIRMSNKFIGREAKGQADILENVADIEQAVMQGKSVVGSMLGYARTDTNPADSTDLSAVVEDTVSLLSKEFLSGIALTLELDRDAPKVSVGRGRLEQMLLNLIVNASEAMQGNGNLKISLRPLRHLPVRRYALRPAVAENFIEMSVVDSGPGIALENQLRIFEPFFTTKRTGAKAGTGLGLSLVYSIAQQDGLGLAVESAPDQGAIFIVLIPVQTENTPVRETHSFQMANPA